MVRGFIYLILSILLISCSDKDNIDKAEEVEMVNVSITASMDNSAATVVSRTTTDETGTETGTGTGTETGTETETGTGTETEPETLLEKFENGEKIGVFLCKAGTNGKEAHTTTHFLNLMAEYISTDYNWIFFVSYTGLVINPAVYNDADKYGNLDCYGYAPYTRTVSGNDDDGDDDLLADITAVPMINDRDIMWAVGSGADSTSNIDIDLSDEMEDLSVGLTFKRAMAKIDFIFKLKNEQTGVIVDNIILTAVEGQDLWGGARLNAIDGDIYECVQATDSKVYFSSNAEIIYDTDEATYKATYESKIIPVNIADKGVELSLIINGQETYNTIPLAAIDLKAGYCYTMEITIDNFLKISTEYGLELNDEWDGDKVEIII